MAMEWNYKGRDVSNETSENQSMSTGAHFYTDLNGLISIRYDQHLQQYITIL